MLNSHMIAPIGYYWQNCVNFSIAANVYILPFDKHLTCRCEAFKWGRKAFRFPYEDKWGEDTLTSSYFYIIYYLMKGLRTGWIIFGFYKRQNLWLTTAIWIKSYIYTTRWLIYCEGRATGCFHIESALVIMYRDVLLVTQVFSWHHQDTWNLIRWILDNSNIP